jgi:hypothetical protein
MLLLDSIYRVTMPKRAGCTGDSMVKLYNAVSLYAGKIVGCTRYSNIVAGCTGCSKNLTVTGYSMVQLYNAG